MDNLKNPGIITITRIIQLLQPI